MDEYKLFKQCYKAAQERVATRGILDEDESFIDQWIKDNLQSATMDDIMSIVEEWRKYDCLIQFRRVDALIRDAVGKAISKYSVEECIKCIQNYATVINDTTYYMRYKWDIKKFFKQSNAAPDFFDNGAKWVNYIEEKGKTKAQKFHSKCDITAKDLLMHSVERYKDLFVAANWPTFVVNTMEIDPLIIEKERQFKFRDVLAKVYPYLFIKAASELGIIVDEAIKNKYNTQYFKASFDNVEILTPNGAVVSKENWKQEYAKLKMK